MQTPFSLTNQALYECWRNRKLAAYPVDVERLMVVIKPPKSGKADQQTGITLLLQTIGQFNLALYRFPTAHQNNKITVHQLATACGLHHINRNLHADTDSLTSIQVSRKTVQQEYIPYTNRPLSWHTDGYYNRPDQQIHGMLMHCVQPATEGGENLFMDHEIAYILLREADPAYIEALMHPETLTIPANIQNGEIIRPTQSGPVFSITAAGNLHMRYSARQRNVQWRSDAVTRKAERFLLDLWEQTSIYQLRYKLQANEGVICNNVLHCRTGFSDKNGEKRLLYRGRYLDRVQSPSGTAT